MGKYLSFLLFTTLIISCNQNQKNFDDRDLIGKWMIYQGDIIIDGQTFVNPTTQGDPIFIEFYKDNSARTSGNNGVLTWKLTQDNHLISKRDTLVWNYLIKSISKNEIEFIEKKYDRVFVWKVRRGWD